MDREEKSERKRVDSQKSKKKKKEKDMRKEERIEEKEIKRMDDGCMDGRRRIRSETEGKELARKRRRRVA